MSTTNVGGNKTKSIMKMKKNPKFCIGETILDVSTGIKGVIKYIHRGNVTDPKSGDNGYTIIPTDDPQQRRVVAETNAIFIIN
ncbi:MAG TPA: hypothetical protein PLW93_03505 [Candidatus Absconditabacterales bacterium]|nr:hypothetical protein [Candidatus Absconditabacterales bacterium]HNG97312.1 hypothetical protein [Candidatus Absconditabacterales bacterium]